MAIIIPSKYIFGDPANEKVRKNVIKTVNLDTSVVFMELQENQGLHKESQKPQNVDVEGFDKSLLNVIVYTSSQQASVIYLHGKPKYSTFNLFVPKSDGKSRVLEIGDVSFEISCSVQKYKYVASASYNGSEVLSLQETSRTLLEEKQEVFAELNREITVKPPNSSPVSITIEDTKNVVVQDNGDYFVVTIYDLITSIEKTSASSNSFNFPLTSSTPSGTVDVVGTNEVYTANMVGITVNGKKLIVNLESKNVQVGDGSYQHSISQDELLQTGTISMGDVATSTIGELIKKQYENGKETIELDCAIADYYRENGEKAISIDGSLPMVFENGDTVIPQKRVGSRDVPYSTYKDGKPKKFMVVSANVYYDGATMQKLYLLET